MNSICRNENNSNALRSRRIATNTVVLFARTLILTIVYLLSVRWVLQALGVEDYGIYNAVAGVVTASTCLSSVLAMATQRFYSYAMGRDETGQLKEIFSASVNISLLIALLVLAILEAIGPWFVQAHLSMPAARVPAALELFQYSLVAFVCSILQIPFLAAVFSHEHMGIYTLVSVFDCLSKSAIAYGLGSCAADRLTAYGLLLMLESVTIMLLYAAIAMGKYGMCRYVVVRRRSLYRQMVSFSGWTFLGTTSSVCMIQGSVILLNVYFGPTVNAAFNVASQIYNALVTLGGSIVIAMRPAMVKAYSKGDTEYLGALFYTSTKALVALQAIVAIPFVIWARTILGWWLGEVTEDMVLFSRLYAVFTVCLSLHNPITTVIQASGDIRRYTICVESVTLLNLPVCWLLFRLGLPPYMLFITMTALCVAAHLVRLHYLRQVLAPFSYGKYLRSLLLRK